MDDNMTCNMRLYTDVQGLNELKYKTDSKEAKKEVAKQFESILLQMVMRSMRNANKAFKSDMFSNDQMDFYQDMFDNQLSMLMSNSGTGFASMVEKNIDQMTNPTHPPTQQLMTTSPTPLHALKNESTDPIGLSESVNFSSQEEFVKKLWPAAKVAADYIGTSPEILLAQAALETNWGKSILSDGRGSSHNLFNIKTGDQWNKDKITKLTLEQKDGVLQKEKANYRSYDSFNASFLDYAQFLKGNDRYQQALTKANDPKQFVHALQDAGYATDQQYAEKIMGIYSSPTFKGMVDNVKKEPAAKKGVI